MNVLMKKAQAQTCALIHSTVTQGQAWIHHKMCFIPSVSYPLLIYHISNDNLHSLQKYYLMALENKLCFNCIHSHGFSFGLQLFGDIGLSDLCINAHIGGIENIIQLFAPPVMVRTLS